jgi:hypothetical protein
MRGHFFARRAARADHVFTSPIHPDVIADRDRAASGNKSMRCGAFVRLVAIISFGVVSVVSSATAHHSLSAYNSNVLLSVTATVLEYEWQNPHIRIHLRPADSDGSEDALVFEGANTGYAARLGWRADSFHIGDTITASYNPFLDGRPGGHLVEIATTEGEIYSLVRFRDRRGDARAASAAAQ